MANIAPHTSIDFLFCKEFDFYTYNKFLLLKQKAKLVQPELL